MGQTQSQVAENFIKNYTNTSFLSDVISRHASSTNSIMRNVQNMNLNIDARDIGGDVRVFQRIDSLIDMNNLVSRDNRTQLTNDIQNAISNELQTGIQRMSEAFSGLFNTPTNQAILNNAINSIDTYVSNTVTNDTIDELLLSADNVQGQMVNLTARDITGDLTFDQRIQADIVARNLIESVTESIIGNKELTTLTNTVKSDITSQDRVPSILGIAAPLVIGLILAIILMIFIPRGKVVVGILTVILAIAVAIFIWRRNVAG